MSDLPAVAASSPLLSRERSVIAVVDDDDALGGALSLWFGMKGLRVMRFGSAEQLLARVRYPNGRTCLGFREQQTADFALAGAILDLNLPGMHGMQLATVLRNNDAVLPIVMITALPAMDRVGYGSPPQGIRCLKKPFELDELTEALFLGANGCASGSRHDQH